MTGGRIENCTLSGNMHAEAPYVGGIVGYLDGGRNLHPNEAGMKVIADKIYAELGAWLEGN